MERERVSDEVIVDMLKVSVTRKVGLPNYSSASATVTVEGKADEGSNIREAIDYLMSVAEDGVNDELVKIIKEG